MEAELSREQGRVRRLLLSTLFAATLAIALLPALASAEEATEEGPAHHGEIVPRNDLSIGGELYRSECSACHAATGLGGALSFRDNVPGLMDFTPLEIAAAIRGGPGEMPFFGPQSIDDEELEQIVTYTIYLQNPDDPGGAPILRAGPLMEGFIAWVIGMGAIVLGLMRIGDRRA